MPKGSFTKRPKSAPVPRAKSPSAPSRPERDALGRLLPGHSVKSPGNPHAQRINEYREAIQAAVTPDELRRIFEKMKRLSLAGDMDAIRELLNRTLGKAKPADSTLAGIKLPDIVNAKDTVRAANSILQALAEGRLNADDAAKLGAIVEMARRSIETHELAERLSSLEKAVHLG